MKIELARHLAYGMMMTGGLMLAGFLIAVPMSGTSIDMRRFCIYAAISAVAGLVVGGLKFASSVSKSKSMDKSQ